MLQRPTETPNVPTCGDSVDRRDFLRQTILLVLGSSALAAGLAGCDGDDDDGGGVQGTLAAAVAAARTALQGIVEALADADTLDAATVTGYVGQVNQHLTAMQALAAGATQADLRALVPAELTAALTQLDGYEETLNFTQAPPQFSGVGLAASAQRAESLLDGLSAGNRRGLWAFTYAMTVFCAEQQDSTIAQLAGLARSVDTEDVAGRLYDAVFGAAAVGSAQTGLAAPGAVPALISSFALLVLLGMHSEAVTQLAFLAPQLVVAMVLLLLACASGLSPWGNLTF